MSYIILIISVPQAHLLYAFDDQYPAGLDSSHCGAVNIDQVTTLVDFSSLLELRLADVSVQGDIFVF